jgi:uracil-DNA glycosylase
MCANRTQFDCHHFTKANEWLVQRYGKGGGVDWDLNVDPEHIVEPSKTDQPKENTETKDKASAKENEVPSQDTKAGRDEVVEDHAGNKTADPEADIDSDEEAALREAGL